jgi:hypothetical protein
MQIDVDISKAQQKLKRAEAQLREGTGDAVKQLAVYTKNRARMHAPRYTGKTISEIRKEKVGYNRYRVRARNPTASRNDGFNLVKWMHQTSVKSAGRVPANRPEDHIRSGKAKFMDAAEADARRYADTVIRNRFDQITFKR